MTRPCSKRFLRLSRSFASPDQNQGRRRLLASGHDDGSGSASPDPGRSGGCGGRPRRLRPPTGSTSSTPRCRPTSRPKSARRVAALLAVPWVADLRDPWALDEMQVFPTRLHRALERRHMRAALRSAAHVIVNTPEAAREIAHCMPELADKVSAITNGFDQDDFSVPPPSIDADVFRIVFTGGAWNLHIGSRQRRLRLVRRVLGGGIKDVDLLSRSAMFLTEATERLLERRPDLRQFVRVEIAGSGSAEDSEEFRSFGGVNHGYLDHAHAVELIRSADLLFLGMQDLGPGQRANTVPGKAYEYIASGRPILAAVPPGDARDLLSSLSNAVLCWPTDVTAIEHAIERLADQKRAHGTAATRRDMPRRLRPIQPYAETRARV